MIPKQIMAIIGFAGIIVHEWAHKFFCNRFGVEVFKIKYWSMNGGYVNHAPIQNQRAAIFIAFAPLIVNTLVAMAFGVGIAIIRLLEFYNYNPDWLSHVNIAFWYFGITIGAHAFPSEEDTKGASDYTKLIKLRIVHFIFIVLNKLRFFWVDYLYALLIISIPTIVLTNAAPDIKAHGRANAIVKEVMEFKKSIESDKSLKLNDGEVLNAHWQRINKKTNISNDITNPFGGTYSATVFNIDAQQKNEEYKEITVVIITTDKVSEDVCKKILTKEVEGMNGIEDRRPKLVQTEEEVETDTPPICKDDNMIIFAFNLGRQA
ncbi:MAG: DUF3267 domain-containing protein [Alphaproteobacteria bacterium]|nr:DUF3267 domain-containing protein [Alphaproteobacteria bacterium]